AQQGSDNPADGHRGSPEADTDRDHRFADGDQQDQAVTLDEMVDVDPEAADRSQVWGGPVEHKAGPEQRPSESPTSETGAEKQDSCDQVEGTQTSHRLHDALLRGAHED